MYIIYIYIYTKHYKTICCIELLKRCYQIDLCVIRSAISRLEFHRAAKELGHVSNGTGELEALRGPSGHIKSCCCGWGLDMAMTSDVYRIALYDCL